MAIKESQAFQEKKKYLALQKKISIEQHEMNMEELKFRRESDRIHHEFEKERMRIKNADIKRTVMMKQDGRSYR